MKKIAIVGCTDIHMEAREVAKALNEVGCTAKEAGEALERFTLEYENVYDNRPLTKPKSKYHK